MIKLLTIVYGQFSKIRLTYLIYGGGGYLPFHKMLTMMPHSL